MNGRGGPQSWIGQLLGICVSLLAAALVLHWAVGLVRSDWPWLVGIAAIVVSGLIAVAWWRTRRNGW